MSEDQIHLYPKMSSLLDRFSSVNQSEQASHSNEKQDAVRLEPSTCVEAETFALRVLDDSMQPEFRQGCIILIDPTGKAIDGSYVLAKTEHLSVHSSSADNQSVSERAENTEPLLEHFLFRQLRRDTNDQWYLQPLNSAYQHEIIEISLSDITGVIVQRAGTRRSYHKHYA